MSCRCSDWLVPFGMRGAWSGLARSPLLRTAPQPTLYLHGDRDSCIDVALVADAQSHLAQDSRMEVIEGVGHFLHVERPRAVNERILAWILS